MCCKQRCGWTVASEQQPRCARSAQIRPAMLRVALASIKPPSPEGQTDICRADCLPSTSSAPSLLIVLCPMLQAGRLPACLHGLAGNGVWLLSLDLKAVERAVRDLGALPPCTCTCRSDVCLDAHKAAHRLSGSQQPDLAHHSSVCHVAMRWPWASAARKQLRLTLAYLACSNLALQQQQASAQASCLAAACLAPPAGCRALDVTSCQTSGAGEVTRAQRAAIARVQPAGRGGHVPWPGAVTMALCKCHCLLVLSGSGVTGRE